MERDYKPILKPRPIALERDERRAKIATTDKKENAKVKARSGGRCEVMIVGLRCKARAGEIHHHLGGWRMRGRGPSALAENKTHACSKHHAQITGNILEHLGGQRYRVRG